MRFSHALIERNVILLMVLTLITVSIGGLVQIVPLFTIERTKPFSVFTQSLF